jgi:hypothetical protein
VVGGLRWVAGASLNGSIVSTRSEWDRSLPHTDSRHAKQSYKAMVKDAYTASILKKLARGTHFLN